jgi:hypothetical protein
MKIYLLIMLQRYGEQNVFSISIIPHSVLVQIKPSHFVEERKLDGENTSIQIWDIPGKLIEFFIGKKL